MSNQIFSSFGLREDPFTISPDPRYLFATSHIEEAWAQLTYGIESRKGLILLTGEVGTGKTTLLRHLVDSRLQRQAPTSFVFNPRLEPGQLINFVLDDFGIQCEPALQGNKLLCLKNWLLDRYRAGQVCVLIIDEAQALPSHLLEEIRVLLNLETPQAKLLQVILSGQPELEDKLKQPELRPFRQRITLRCKTAPLTLDQTHSYIGSRLHCAGANGHQIFAPLAMDAVYLYSHGIPRVINLLCEHALINAYSQHSAYVFEQTVRTAARDCQLDELPTSAAFAGRTEPLDILDPKMYFPIEEANQPESPVSVDVPPAPVPSRVATFLQSPQIPSSAEATPAVFRTDVPEPEPQRTFFTPQPLPPASRPSRPDRVADSTHTDSPQFQVPPSVPISRFFSRITSTTADYATRALSHPWIANLSKIPRSFFAELKTHPRDFKVVFRSFVYELKSHPITLWVGRHLTRERGLPNQIPAANQPPVTTSPAISLQNSVASRPRSSSPYRAKRSAFTAIATHRLTASALRWLQKPMNAPSARDEAPAQVERRKVQR